MAFYRCNFEQDATLGTKSIVKNGTYLAQNDNLDGYSQVSVNVPTPIVQGSNLIPPIASAEDLVFNDLTGSGESITRNVAFFDLPTEWTPTAGMYVMEYDITMNITSLYSPNYIGFQKTSYSSRDVWLVNAPDSLTRLETGEKTIHVQIMFDLAGNMSTIQNGLLKYDINNVTVGAWSIKHFRIYKVNEVISPYPTDKPTWFETTDLVVDTDTESLVVSYDTTRRLVFALVYNASNAFGERNYTEMIQVAKNRSHQPEENKFYKFNGITDYRGYESPDSYGGVSVDETSGTVTFNARGNGYIWRGGRTYRVIFVYDSNPVTPTEE